MNDLLFALACAALIVLFVIDYMLYEPLRDEKRRHNDGRRLIAELQRNHPDEVE